MRLQSLFHTKINSHHPYLYAECSAERHIEYHCQIFGKIISYADTLQADWLILAKRSDYLDTCFYIHLHFNYRTNVVPFLG